MPHVNHYESALDMPAEVRFSYTKTIDFYYNAGTQWVLKAFFNPPVEFIFLWHADCSPFAFFSPMIYIQTQAPQKS